MISGVSGLFESSKKSNEGVVGFPDFTSVCFVASACWAVRASSSTLLISSCPKSAGSSAWLDSGAIGWGIWGTGSGDFAAFSSWEAKSSPKSEVLLSSLITIMRKV